MTLVSRELNMRNYCQGEYCRYNRVIWPSAKKNNRNFQILRVPKKKKESLKATISGFNFINMIKSKIGTDFSTRGQLISIRDGQIFVYFPEKWKIVTSNSVTLLFYSIKYYSVYGDFWYKRDYLFNCTSGLGLLLK